MALSYYYSMTTSRRGVALEWVLLAAAMFSGMPPGTAVLAADPAAPAADEANLRPKFVAGRTARYDIWSLRKQDVTMSFLGETQKNQTALETQGEITWRTDRVNADGSATCTMTIEWLTATSRTDDDEAHADSRKAAADNPAIHAVLKAIAGVPIAVEMAADGTVTAVKGVDAIRNKLGKDGSAPDELDFMETAADLAAIAAAQEKAALNRNWKTAADWNHELGKLHHDTTFTLTGLEEVAGIRLATVTGVAKLRLDLDKSKIPGGGVAGGPQIDVKLASGEATTQVMFDLSRREAVGRNSIQTTRIEARITHMGQVLTRLMDETIQSQALRIEEK